MTDDEHEILKAWHANGICYETSPYKKIFAFARALESRVLAERKQAEYADDGCQASWSTMTAFPYQKTFNAIAAATEVQAGRVAISVIKFREAFGPITHPTPDDASIQERIPKGWCLYACDFSIQGSPGSVTLKRDKEGVSWWFSLPEYRREKTDLFLYGRGKTIEEALDAAIDRARQSAEEGK
jgi:hypothetical protein